MNTLFFAGMLGGWEIILIMAVILLLFGAKKLPELAKGLGQGIKEFKKATTDVQRDLQSALEEDSTPPPTAPKIAAEKTEIAQTPAATSSTQPTSPKA